MQHITRQGVIKNFFKILLVGAAVLCISPKNSLAALPPVPSGQDLNAQAERFRQEHSIETRSREKSKSKVPLKVQEENVSAVNGASFVLKEIDIRGMTAFDIKDLRFIWKSYFGKKIDFDILNNFIKSIKQAYKDKGYLTTVVYLPPQKIEDGIVEIRVLEGKLGHLTVEGNRWFSTSSIEKYFHAIKGEILNLADIQKDVMRLNENKDLKVSSVLSPGTEPETVDVTLKAQENLPYHVSIGTDDQGSRLTGRYRRLVNISTSNLTGNEDSLSFNGAYTDLSSGYYLSYQTPVGTNRVKAGLDTGYFQGKLGQEYKSFDINNYTDFYDPNLSFELYQSENAQTNFRTGMKIEHINKKEGVNTLTDEDLRIPYLAIDNMETDSMGQTNFSPEVIFGTSGFLAGSRSDNSLSSRPGVDRFFTKYDQYLSRSQIMPWGSYIQFTSQFQTASRTLPTSEQLQLGGVGSVRGYPLGDYLADIGGYLQTEWYFPMYAIPASVQWHDISLRQAIEPFIFYDTGGGKLISVNSGETSKRFLQGTGAGVRIRIKNNIYLKIDWAMPTGQSPIKGTGPSTVDVSFQMGF